MQHAENDEMAEGESNSTPPQASLARRVFLARLQHPIRI